MGQPKEIRDRMAKAIEDFVYELLTSVFNAGETASLALETILEAGFYDIGPKGSRIEDPADWTEERISQKAAAFVRPKGPSGVYEN